MLTFHATDPGGYRLSAAYAPGQNGPPVVLAVGHDVGQLLAGVFGGAALIAASVLIAIALVGMTFILRLRARRRTAGYSTE